MQIKQSFNNELLMDLSINDDVSDDFISIKYFIFEHIKNHFLKSIWISTEYDSISLINRKIYVITNILEIFQWNFFVLDWSKIRETFYKIKMLLSSHLSPSRIWRFSQHVKYNSQTIKWYFSFSKSFEIESVQIEQIDKHSDPQTYKWCVCALILDSQDHYHQKHDE